MSCCHGWADMYCRQLLAQLFHLIIFINEEFHSFIINEHTAYDLR